VSVRFDARHIGSGLRAIWDGAVMSFRATNLGKGEARQKAAGLNVVFVPARLRESAGS
jgi:hypothetical protein